jgi:hypothetical protein
VLVAALNSSVEALFQGIETERRRQPGDSARRAEIPESVYRRPARRSRDRG